MRIRFVGPSNVIQAVASQLRPVLNELFPALREHADGRSDGTASGERS
jgi:hypothetical protein